MYASHSDITGKKCSCSSCFYKNASENPSLKDMLAGGSKIDKLFLGKFLPMREQKLLDRLVRTRAIYDDIRNQLLAESNDSSDAKPEKREKNYGQEIDTNSAILQLVNLVDKGAARKAPLSDCCSCCSCDSIIKLKEHAVKGHRAHQHRHSYTGIRQDMRDKHKISKHRDHRDRRLLKHVRSDPCACINPRSKKLLKRMSRALSRRSRSRSKLGKLLPPGTMVQEYDNKRADKINGRHRRESGMGETIRKSITKMKQTKKNVESGVKKSIENIQTTKKKIKETVSGSFRKLEEKTKDNRELKDAELLRLFESTFGINLSKDLDLDHKKIMEKWACDFECDPEECTPLECFKEKKRNILKNQPQGGKVTGTQVKKEKITMGTETKQHKIPAENVKKRSAAVDQRANLKRKRQQKGARHQTIEINVKRKDKETEDHSGKKAENSAAVGAKSKSNISLPSKSSQVAMQSPTTAAKRKFPLKTSKEHIQENLQQLKPPGPLKTKSVTSIRKVSSKSSQVSVKVKKDEKTSKERPAKATKRTKEKAKKLPIEHKNIPQGNRKPIHRGSIPDSKQALQEFVQRPSEQRVVKTASPTPVTEKRRIPGAQDERQAVRIGSSFSFNIEFYKNKSDKSAPRTVKNRKVHHRDRETRLTQKPIRHRASSTSRSVKKDAQTGEYNLKRCFCTLTLKPKGTKAKTSKTHNRHVSQSLTKSMQTIRAKKQTVLLPYECEPMVCVPGECDPYECIKLIRKRNLNHHSAHITTQHPHRSKSTPSQTSKLISPKTTETQSSNVISSRDKKHFSHREPVIRLVDPNSPRRQAVRIGSTFSFNIDFYKGDPPHIQEVRTINTWDPPRRDTLKFAVRPTGKRNINTGPGRNTIKINRASRQPRIRLAHTPSQVSRSVKSKNTSTKHSLRRCFCTLKLAKHEGHKKQTISNQATVTSGLSVSSVEAKRMAVEKGTKVKNKLILSPNECEPYFCVPGECGPYQCLKKLKMREGIISKNAGMTTSSDKNKSISSGTSSITTAKNTQIQSTLEVQKPRKSRMRSTYTVSNDHPKAKPEVLRKNTSRQAVRIGSSMSVDIEFFKEKKFSQRDFERVLHKKDSSPSKTWKNEGDNPRTVRKNKYGNPHTVQKNKGDNLHTASVMGRVSQTSKLEQTNKATGIRPMLKRCFCTLKLQNKRRNKRTEKRNTRHNETTVMPVQVFYKNINLQESIKKNTDTSKRKIETANLLCDASKFSSVKQNGSKSESIIKKILNTGIDFRRTDLLKTLIKRSFYSMNVQVKKSEKKKYKLGKYECEPGVCLPGECDPVECQKRIMRRLMGRASTMTSSENRTKSMSSETARLQPHLRAQKQQFREPTQRTAPESGLRYETLPRNHKQAVRIGSNFSFNIEFSKDKSADVVSCPRGRPCTVVCAETSCDESHFKTKCVGGCTTRNLDGKSQSGIAMYHKGSMITPKPKRCFCTLELFDKKNQYQGFDFKMNGVPPEKIIKFNTRGQNTKNLKAYDISNLEPYECEPNVCIPGECDPYKCLERVKRRNKRINTDIGTGQVSKNASASSMTHYKPVKSKHAQYKRKIRQERPQKSYKPVTKSFVHLPPSTRQAVRIGSNFSFDVEFFKNKSSPNDSMEVSPSQHNYHKQKPGSKIAKTQKNRYRVDSSQKSVQDSIVYKNQNDQAKPATRNESTKTNSFLKRCFCTAKLFKQQNKTDKPKEEKRINRRHGKPKMQKPEVKCMVSRGTDSPYCKIIPNLKNANYEANPFKLQPYECEPGVCIPGECNPYDCEKLIKKRLLKESSTSAQTYGTKSSTNSMPHKKKNKNRYAQSFTSNFKSLAKKDQLVHTISREQFKHSKQAVRIGSNFNFNIEFYKDKSHHIDANKVKKKPHLYKNQEIGEHNEKRNKGITSSQAKFVHRQSQIEKQNTETRGVGPLIKRCFCTLKLQKLGKYKQPQNDHFIPHTIMKDSSVVTESEFEPVFYKEVGTKTRQNFSQLEPYECEPGTCVPAPGLCNPTECYERIKRRYLRSQITETERSIYECEPGVCIPGECDPYKCLERIEGQRKQYKSECTMCEPLCSPSRCVSTGCDLLQSCSPGQIQTDESEIVYEPRFPPLHPQDESKIVYEPRFPSLHPQYWQGVKIGSNVSLNIEFYKEKVFPNEVPIPNSYGITKPSRMYNKNVGINDNRKTHFAKDTNTHYGLRHKHMQANHGAESKASATGKALKRCFCTAELHQPGTGYLGNQAVTVGHVHKITTLSPFNTIYCKCSKSLKEGKKMPKAPETLKDLTVVEISGHELTKTISRLRDPEKTITGTPVFKVGGTDMDVKVKGEHQTLLHTENKHISTQITHERKKEKNKEKKISTQITHERKKEKNKEKKVKRTQTKCRFVNTFTHCQLLNDIGNGSEGLNLNNLEEPKQKYKNLKNHKKIRHVLKHSKKAQLKNKKPANTDNKCTDEYTLIKLSGEDLTKNISVIWDSRGVLPETTLVTVGGAEIDCEISRKNINTNEDIAKNKKISEKNCNKTCTHCKFLKAGAENFNRALKKDTNKDRQICDNGNLQDMETVLPFEPKYYRKNKSRSALGHRRHNYCCSACVCSSELCPKIKYKQEKIKYITGDHNLTSSWGKTTIKKKPFMKRLFCVLFPISSNCEPDVDFIDSTDNVRLESRGKGNLKKSKSERKTYYKSPYFEPKKSKSAKIPHGKNKTQVVKKRYNRSQPKDVDPNIPGYLIEREILCDGHKLSKNGNKRVKFALTPEIVMNKEDKNEKDDIRDGRKTLAKKKQKKKQQNQKNTNNYIEVKISGKRLKKDICSSKDPKQNTLVTVSGSYVGCEISKRVPKDSVASCAETCSYCSKFGKKTKPTVNYDLNRNADEKTIASTHSNKKDKYKSRIKSESCRCCVCKKINKLEAEKFTHDKKKNPSKEYKKGQNKKTTISLRMKAKKPCVCGSPACKGLATLANSDTVTLLKKGYRCLTLQKRVCTCQNKTCNCAYYIKKQAEAKAKMKRLEKLRLERKIADKIRSERQKAYDEYMNSKARKFRKRSNALLWAESALDLSKIGMNVTAGATRAVYRTITDPGNTCDAMRTMVKQPKKGFIRCKKVFRDSGALAALRRVKMRFASMPYIKRAKKGMEDFAPTNFMLHMGDKDPKKRLKNMPKKKQKIKKREAVDFACSLFMASLRKKPCLALYYMCPWFYPHLLSLLTVWKQFVEIVLFLLAIGVWSPCLLVLEIFRMFVCCCLCGA